MADLEEKKMKERQRKKDDEKKKKNENNNDSVHRKIKRTVEKSKWKTKKKIFRREHSKRKENNE